MAKKKSKANSKKSESQSSTSSNKKREDIVQKTEQEKETETTENTEEPQSSKSNVLSDESGENLSSPEKSWGEKNLERGDGRSSFQPRYGDDKYGSNRRKDDDRNQNKSHFQDRKGYSRRSEPFGNQKESSYGERRERYSNDDDWRQTPGGSSEKSDRRRPYRDRDESEYGQYQREFRKTTSPVFVKTIEIEGDLFKMPEEYSLAHCVAEDMNMGSGIAVQFRRDFKRVDELLNQRTRTGGLAILSQGDRFIYYLVTKQVSTGKPTNKTLFSSLVELRRHVIEKNVKKLAMPKIGCGLDRLQWDEVKFMIEYIFREVDVEIKICNLIMTEESPQQRHRNLKLTNESYPIEKIDVGTIIVYLSSEDEYISDEMKALDEKFNFLREFKFAKKILGNVVFFTKNQKYLLCGCIVKKRSTDDIDFVAFQKCLRSIQKENGKTKFYYIAMQAFRDENDPCIMQKIINILRNSLRDMEVYICWPGDLQNDLLSKDSYNSYKSNLDWDPRRKTMDPEVLRKDTKYTKDDTEQEVNVTPMETGDTHDWFNVSENPKDAHNTSITTGMVSLGVDDQHKESWSEEDEPKDVHKHNEQLPQKNDEETCQKTWNQNTTSYSNRLKQAGHFENSDSQSCKKQKQFHQGPIQKNENTLVDPDEEFEKYKREKEEIQLKKVKHQQLPKKYSRVCYAREDMIIESCIPKGSDITPLIGQLLNQNQKEGDCTFVKDGNEYLYCPLIRGPLTIPSSSKIFLTLQKLRDHVKKNNTKKLVIPKMDDDDCFKWSEMEYMLEFLFKNVPIEIILDLTPEDHKIKIDKNRLKNVKFTINSMKKKSILIYLASVDGKFTKPMLDLKQKYEFDGEFIKMKRIVGQIIRHKENEDHVIYGCVVRRSLHDSVNFHALQKCLNDINQQNSDKEKLAFAYLQIEEDFESNVNFKMGTLLLTCLPECTIFLGWPGELFKKVPTNYP